MSAIPERFGHGAIEGVAGPEAANNAAASSAFIPLILMFCVIGVYGTTGSVFFLYLMAGFGLLGYLMRKLDYPSAPLILGLVLGDGMERALRQSLMMSQGDLSILWSRPISATMLVLTAVILLLPVFRRANAWRVRAIQDAEHP